MRHELWKRREDRFFLLLKWKQKLFALCFLFHLTSFSEKIVRQSSRVPDLSGLTHVELFQFLIFLFFFSSSFSLILYLSFIRTSEKRELSYQHRLLADSRLFKTPFSPLQSDQNDRPSLGTAIGNLANPGRPDFASWDFYCWLFRISLLTSSSNWV